MFRLKMSAKRLRSTLLLMASCYAVDSFIYAQKSSSWRQKARKEFWRSSYAPLPVSLAGEKDVTSFQPRMDFPLRVPTTSSVADLPPAWKRIDFRSAPEEYLQRLLEKCLESNVEVGFDMTAKKSDVWYHAPWMSYWATGREPIHGLTFERPASVGYLSDTQQRVCQVWAVGFYNEIASTEFAKVWKVIEDPDVKASVDFPEGSIVFKLLFTDATVSEVSYLKDSPEWKAVIAKDSKNPGDRNEYATSLRLLQLDVAVKDDRSEIGWVFGTFMYHCNAKSGDPWDRLVPVSLQWGNDPDYKLANFENGDKLKQTWNNDKLITLVPAAKPESRPYWGFHGRANGPADHYKSCCVSCHSTASMPIGSSLSTPPYKAPSDADETTTLNWFRNLKPVQKFDSTMGESLDYSLQMQNGIKSFLEWKRTTQPKRFVPWLIEKLVV